jgi:hypothetical protein
MHLLMKQLFLSLMLLFLLIQTMRGQNPIIAHDSIIIVENTLKKVSKNINFTILPGPVYGPTEKLGFMVLPMIVYDLDKQDTLSPPSSSALMFYFDFYGSWYTAIKQSFYWNQNKWRAFISVGAGDLKLKFFGIGLDSVIVSNDDSNYVWMHQKSFNVSAVCFRKIYKGLYGGLEYRYTLSTNEGADSLSSEKLVQSGFPPEQLNESVFVPAFIWDNRDNIFWSTKGYYASLSFQLANGLLFSSKNYGVLAGWVNGYHRLLRDRRLLILAWHFYAQSAWGELPYVRYANFGQVDNATGYTRGKYVNNSEVSIQAELRYELWKFISCGGYAGTGKTFSSLSDFGKSVWLHFGGLRLYFNIIPSRNIRLRFDAAIARKDWGVYVGIGQGF